RQLRLPELGRVQRGLGVEVAAHRLVELGPQRGRAALGVGGRDARPGTGADKGHQQGRGEGEKADGSDPCEYAAFSWGYGPWGHVLLSFRSATDRWGGRSRYRSGDDGTSPPKGATMAASGAGGTRRAEASGERSRGVAWTARQRVRGD